MYGESPLILVAIGDERVRQMVGRVLAQRGCRVLPGAPGAGILELIDGAPVACALVEGELGSPDLAEMLAAIGQRHPELPVILMGSQPAVATASTPRGGGVRGFLPSPLELPALVNLVASAVRPAELEGARALVPERLRSAGQGAPPEEGTRQVQQLAAAALDALVYAMEAKDPHLPGHSLRVAELAASIATKMGRADWEVEEVRLAGRLHDIGMIAIGAALLTKAGPLSPEEYAEVKRHPSLGYQILSAYPNMERVACYVRGHHERWDGQGYPDRLAGESIPWGARVLAAAETFDALTSSRSYRSATSVVEALERMHQLSADAMDPEVMRVLQRVVSKRETLSFIREDDTLAVERSLITPDQDPLSQHRVA